MFTGVLSCGTDRMGRVVELRSPDRTRPELGLGVLTDPVLMEKFMLNWKQPPTIESYPGFLDRAEKDPSRYSSWIWVGGQFAGLAGLWEIGANKSFQRGLTGRIFYVVTQEYQRQRIASVVIQRLLQFAFEDCNLVAVEIEIREDNLASLSVAIKQHFWDWQFNGVGYIRGTQAYGVYSSYRMANTGHFGERDAPIAVIPVDIDLMDARRPLPVQLGGQQYDLRTLMADPVYNEKLKWMRSCATDGYVLVWRGSARNPPYGTVVRDQVIMHAQNGIVTDFMNRRVGTYDRLVDEQDYHIMLICLNSLDDRP